MINHLKVELLRLSPPRRRLQKRLQVHGLTGFVDGNAATPDIEQSVGGDAHRMGRNRNIILKSMR